MSQHNEYTHYHHEDGAFRDIVVEQVRNAPWLLISLAIHVLIAIVLNFMSTTPNAAEQVREHQASLEVLQQEPVDIPEVKDEINEINPLEVVTDEPVVKDTEISDHTETDNDREHEESLSDQKNFSDKPFDMSNAMDTIGIGGGGGGAFPGRGGNDNLKKNGGGGHTQETVNQSLEWLSNHQSEDGRWDCDNFMSNGDPSRGPLCNGKGMATYDVGVTGLALLCFLGAGHTHREGNYTMTVLRGLKWLRDQQDADGCFGPRGDQHFTYSHAIAALAMAEAYGMSRSGIWKNSAQDGINYVMQCQNPYKAWRYGERPGDNDVSVTGWMVMALKSAKAAGLDVNDACFQWALDFVNEMTDEENGRTGYTKRGELPVRAEGRLEQFPATESESLTGVGILTRVFCGQDPAATPEIKAGAELISRRLPVWEPKSGKVDMYYWYYATLAMYQVGGEDWVTWNARLKDAVITPQRTDGNYAGSWDPIGAWGEDGGRVYSTALMTLCMEVYYRYGRVFGAKVDKR